MGLDRFQICRCIFVLLFRKALRLRIRLISFFCCFFARPFFDVMVFDYNCDFNVLSKITSKSRKKSQFVFVLASLIVLLVDAIC